MSITDYFDAVKERLLSAPVVAEFQITRERTTMFDGHMRARLTLTDGSWLEFSEYVRRRAKDEIAVVTYSYHWADVHNHLIRRWDNTPHFPDVPNFPYHVHERSDDAVAPSKPMSIFVVLDEISSRL